MTRTLVVVFVCALAGAGGALLYLTTKSSPSSPPVNSDGSTRAGTCAKHQIEEARCPFCNPALIASMGECKEHGVAEALCFRCRPELGAAFKAEGDWCAAHGVPESQCGLCKKGDLPPGEQGKTEAGKASASEAREPETGRRP